MINDCPVDFELEQDKKISDVINSVSEWTRQRDLVFYELVIDDNCYSIDGVPDTDLSGVKVINCIVQSKADIVFSSVDEATRYCDRVSDFMRQVAEGGSWGSNDIRDLRDGIAWLLDVIGKVSGLLGVSTERIKYKDRELSQRIRSIEAFNADLDRDGADLPGLIAANRESIGDLRHIFRMLLVSDEMRSLIIQSIDSPDVLISSITTTKDELVKQIASLQTAAVAYQMGKDPEGSERLKSFVEYIFHYIRTCYQLVPMFRIDLTDIAVDGVSLEQKNRDLRELLHEIITVMENNDIISLSDILEYEMKPAIENLGVYLDLLQGAITGR